MNKNYYEILGVEKTATSDQIKQAYRSIALTNHPDKNPDNPEAEQLFKSASQAYQILSDSEKRKQYDMTGYSPYDNEAFDFGHFNPGDIFRDLFGGMFGGMNFHFTSGARPQKPVKNSILYNVNVDLKTLFNGKNITIPNVNVRVNCSDCNGVGSNTTQKVYNTCTDCNGSGTKVYTYENGPFTSHQMIPCDKCKQTGKILQNPCNTCNGSGHLTQTQELELIIPPKTAVNTRLTLLQNELNSIFVDIHYLSGNDGYELSINQDITKEIKIGVVEAVKGTSIDLVYLDDSIITVQIPEGTQDGSQITIQDRGINLLGKVSDLVIIVNVLIPKYSQLDEREQKLFDTLGGTIATEQN